MKKFCILCCLSMFLLVASFLQAEESSDYKFINMNLLYGLGMENPYLTKNDQYFELEFGGKSGALRLYGYFDVLNVFQNKTSDMKGLDNFFTEIKPKIAIDELFGKKFFLGNSNVSLQNIFVTTELKAGDSSLMYYYLGLGTDIVTKLGNFSISLNSVYKAEDYGSVAQNKFDGYMLDTSWFLKLKTFKNGAYLAYQGYLTYSFGGNKIEKAYGRTSDELQNFNGIYYHFNKIAIGYGLKIYYNMGFIKDSYVVGGVKQETTGLGHFFDLTYKF